MTRADKTVLWHIVFFCAVGVTLEAYWLIHASELTGRQDIFAMAFRIYGQGDRGYFDQISGFELALEFINVVVTVPAYMVLFYGILAGKSWRWPLQLCIGSYVTYSVILYFTAKHAAHYAQMPRHDLGSFLLFYLPNIPWLTGNAFLAIEASLAIVRAARLQGRAA